MRDVAIARDAMLYNLGLVGLAASGMTKSFRARHKRVPWRRVIQLREIVGHPDRILNTNMLSVAMRELIPLLIERFGGRLEDGY